MALTSSPWDRDETLENQLMKKIFLLPVLLLPLIGFAQPYSIVWSRITGGGGSSTGGLYQVSGTVGQHDAGVMSGGNYFLAGGFWSLLSVGQTPGAPLLSITFTSTNTAMVSWPSPSTGFNLQQNTNSIGTANWSTVVSGIQDNGTIKYLIVTPPTGNRFYRLTKP
jgi:hypothetical protein